MGGTMTWQGMQSQPQLSPSELFPSICRMQDGTVLRVSPRMTHHLQGDGELYTLKGTDNGSGNITWGTSWQKIYSRKGDQWDVRGGQPSLIPSGPYAGRVVIVMWEAEWLASRLYIDYLSPWPAVRVASYTRILLSTDATCTAWTEHATLPPGAPSTAPEINDCNEAPVVFLPNGDWMTCCYTRETHDYIGWYSASYFRSTDDGATWTHEGFVGPRANPAQPQDTTYLADEPQFLVLQNGEMLCMIRALEAGSPQQPYHHLYRCANPTARGAMNWVLEGRIPASVKAGSRAALWQHSNGMVLHGFRVVVGSPTEYGTSAQGAWMTSNDNGHAWDTPRNLDSGAVTAGATGAIYSYGAWAEMADGSMVHAYCEDRGPAGGYTKVARFTVVSDATHRTLAPATETDVAQALTFDLRTSGLTLDPDAYWQQSGTALTVHAAVGQRREATGVVSSGTGGQCSFRGADAGDFEVSLNGTDWAPTVIVPAGDTPVWLAVQVSATGTISAEFGVPA